MNSSFVSALSLLLSVAALGFAQTPVPAAVPTTSPTASTGASNTGVASVAKRLPIQRVVLYKNGIGYFEHVGPVRDRQEVSISFTSAQLNDVLKSLTVLDLNGGRIGGVAYGSKESIDRQLGALPISPGEVSSLLQLLGNLRGARVEIRGGAGSALTGRLLSVERKAKASGDTTVEADYVSILTDSGDLRSVEMSSATNLRLLEKELAQKVSRYLDVVAQEREPDMRTMTISTEGSGARNLFVSYISEVPVWKSTYRVVFGNDEQKLPLLQGWAIVDNTVGQDWENVEISLVAGAPQSFIQNLSQPLYTRRPVIEVSSSAMTMPQTHEATLRVGGGELRGIVTDPTGAVVPGVAVRAYDGRDQLVGETRTGSAGSYELSGLPEGVLRLEFSATGFREQRVHGVNVAATGTAQRNAMLQIGSVSESAEIVSAVPKPRPATPSRIRVSEHAMSSGLSSSAMMATQSSGDRQDIYNRITGAQSGATAQDTGDLFEYTLKQRLSIPKDHSALVPIIHSTINAEKVSLWNASVGSRRPMLALWINNSTGLTIDGGVFNVIDSDTFAGEGIWEAIRPDERRLVTYATDLALRVNSNTTSTTEDVSRVRIYRGMLIHEKELRSTRMYTIRNEDAKPRTVIIEHPIQAQTQLLADLKPEEETDRWKRFRVVVGAKETKSLPIQESRKSPTTYQLTNVDDNLIAMFVRLNTITPEIEAALRRILNQKRVIAELTERRESLTLERGQIFEDQKRVRENMKSLKGSAEEKALLQRYTEQLNAQEDRVQALDADLKQVAADITKAREELERLISTVEFNEEIKQG